MTVIDPGEREKFIPLPAHVGSARIPGERMRVVGRHELRDRGPSPRTTPLGTRGKTRHRRGRRRGARSTGRYPFLTAARRYLEDLRPYRLPLTLEQLRRDLRTVERDLRALCLSGEARTMNPAKIEEREVAALLLRWTNRPTRYGTPMDPTSQRHLFVALKGLLAWCGNGVVERMKARSHVRFPRTIEKPIEVLTLQDLQRLRAAAATIAG